jgi:hypothetical protein
MWTKPIEVGGIVGDNQSYITGNSYFEGSAYSQRFTNPIIVAGILIYNPPVSFTGTSSGPTTALDLSTGNILWQSTYLPNSDPTTSGPPNNVPVISFAYVYDLQDPIQRNRRSLRNRCSRPTRRTITICHDKPRHHYNSQLELS